MRLRYPAPLQQEEPVALADVVPDLRLPDRDVLAVLYGVAGQADRELDALRAALLDELELRFGDVDGQLQRVVDAKRRQGHRLRLGLKRGEVQSPTVLHV